MFCLLLELAPSSSLLLDSLTVSCDSMRLKSSSTLKLGRLRNTEIFFFYRHLYVFLQDLFLLFIGKSPGEKVMLLWVPFYYSYTHEILC